MVSRAVSDVSTEPGKAAGVHGDAIIVFEVVNQKNAVSPVCVA